MSLTQEEECALFQDIQAAECRVRIALAPISAVNTEVDAILTRPSEEQKKSPVARWRQLEKAVTAAQACCMLDPSVFDTAKLAKASLDEARRLRWRLARSAHRIVEQEAQKRLFTLVPPKTLIRCGRAGLIRAAYWFDPARGIRFSTYARWWVCRLMNQKCYPNDTHPNNTKSSDTESSDTESIIWN